MSDTRLFSRALCRGLNDRLVATGILQYPSKTAQDHAADYVAIHSGMPDPATQGDQITTKVAHYLCDQLVHASQILCEQAGGYSPEVTKTASAADPESLSWASAEALLEKCAAEVSDGTLLDTTTPPNDLAEAAQHSEAAARENRARPAGYAENGTGDTQLPEGELVDEGMPAKQANLFAGALDDLAVYGGRATPGARAALKARAIPEGLTQYADEAAQDLATFGGVASPGARAGLQARSLGSRAADRAVNAPIEAGRALRDAPGAMRKQLGEAADDLATYGDVASPSARAALRAQAAMDSGLNTLAANKGKAGLGAGAALGAGAGYAAGKEASFREIAMHKFASGELSAAALEEMRRAGLFKGAAEGALLDESTPPNTAANSTDTATHRDAKDRPDNYASDGSDTDGVPMVGKEVKQAALREAFHKTAAEVVPYLPSKMEDHIKVAHVRRMFGLSHEERAEYLVNFYKSAGYTDDNVRTIVTHYVNKIAESDEEDEDEDDEDLPPALEKNMEKVEEAVEGDEEDSSDKKANIVSRTQPSGKKKRGPNGETEAEREYEALADKKASLLAALRALD